MPRDRPTRRVFVSRSHFVSFIPLSTTTCGLRPRSRRSGDALPCCFLRWALPRCSCPTPFADVWDIQHVPCLAPFVVRVETLAFIRKKYKSDVTLYHAVSLLLDIGKNTSVRPHVGHRPSWSTCHARRTPRESHPDRRATVIMTNEPSNHRPNLSHCEVAQTKEPS